MTMLLTMIIIWTLAVELFQLLFYTIQIKVWDARHCTLLQTLKGHSSAVFSIDADDEMKKLYSGSADKVTECQFGLNKSFNNPYIASCLLLHSE